MYSAFCISPCFLLFFWWMKFQQFVYAAIQSVAKSCKYIYIQAFDGIVAILV